jgi:hypothetical protein
MTDITTKNGWERLANGFDVEFRHGIPIRLADNGKDLTIPESALIDEITTLAGLRIHMGEWQPGETPDEHEAQLRVFGEQFEAVLGRLALAAATLFIDRFGKPVDQDDVDWDTLEFDSDFRTALDYCGLEWEDIDKDSYRDGYLATMHQETRRLAASREAPRVEPEE